MFIREINISRIKKGRGLRSGIHNVNSEEPWSSESASLIPAPKRKLILKSENKKKVNQQTWQH
jgi:hypothetical protein